MRLRSPIGIPVLALLLAATAVGPLVACSVPVFRYALERWPADNYRVSVLHRGALSDAEQALVDRLNPESATGHKSANVKVRTLDLDDKSADAIAAREELTTRIDGKLPAEFPAIIVEYPVENPPAWIGVLNEQNVNQLLDSPARREVARRLLKGETAVWVFLESGDKVADESAFNTLKTELALASLNIKLPEIDAQDVTDGLVSIEPDQLRVAFSLLRVSREDAAEKLFVETLLGTEGVGPESLRDPELAHKPMTFPIFGRGRALYALVDKGINEETIATACKTLVGPCTCEVKDKNPGVDLIMSINWNDLVESTIDIDKELPPLAGLANFAGPEKSSSEAVSTQVADADATFKSEANTSVSSVATGASAPISTGSNPPAKTEAAASQPVTATAEAKTASEEMNPVAFNTLILVGLVACAVVVGSLFVIRRG